MTTMREKCARAMQASPAWPAVFDAGTANVLLDAVLSTLLEPDEGMVIAGMEIQRMRSDRRPSAADSRWLVQSFQAMIRKAKG